MATLLPEKWSHGKRMGFLAWLAGPAGLLTDRSDGTLDELADEAGLPHLPYLEEMPDELEVDWNK